MAGAQWPGCKTTHESRSSRRSGSSSQSLAHRPDAMRRVRIRSNTLVARPSPHSDCPVSCQGADSQSSLDGLAGGRGKEKRQSPNGEEVGKGSFALIREWSRRSSPMIDKMEAWQGCNGFSIERMMAADSMLHIESSYFTAIPLGDVRPRAAGGTCLYRSTIVARPKQPGITDCRNSDPRPLYRKRR
jgi:hypothetical protein